MYGRRRTDRKPSLVGMGRIREDTRKLANSFHESVLQITEQIRDAKTEVEKEKLKKDRADLIRSELKWHKHSNKEF